MTEILSVRRDPDGQSQSKGRVFNVVFVQNRSIYLRTLHAFKMFCTQCSSYCNQIFSREHRPPTHINKQMYRKIEKLT